MDDVPGIYRVCSIARPVDPLYPSNRLLLIVLPVGAVGSVVATAAGVLDGTIAGNALAALLIGFAAWALARELSPDQDYAAFLALALAWLQFLTTGASAVLPLFVALFVARVANRSTGLALRPWDTATVVGLLAYASFSGNNKLLLLGGAVAFVGDAWLDANRPLHMTFGGLCLGIAGWTLVTDFPDLILTAETGLVIGIGVALLVNQLLHGVPTSVCDALGRPLSLVRIHLAVASVWLVALAYNLRGIAWTDSLLWAVLAAIPISTLATRLFGRSSKHSSGQG